MKKYAIRVVKNIAFFAIFFIFIPDIINILRFGTASATPLGSRSSDYIMIGIVLLGGLLTPFYWYSKKGLTFDASARVEDVERIMNERGFKRIESESRGSNNMLFTASKISKRLWMLWEDKIEITTVDGISSIEGDRNIVTSTVWHMNKQIG